MSESERLDALGKQSKITISLALAIIGMLFAAGYSHWNLISDVRVIESNVQHNRDSIGKMLTRDQAPWIADRKHVMEKLTSHDELLKAIDRNVRNNSIMLGKMEMMTHRNQN